MFTSIKGRGLLGDFEFANNMAYHSQPEVRTVREHLRVIVFELS